MTHGRLVYFYSFILCVRAVFFLFFCGFFCVFFCKGEFSYLFALLTVGNLSGLLNVPCWFVYISISCSTYTKNWDRHA